MLLPVSFTYEIQHKARSIRVADRILVPIKDKPDTEMELAPLYRRKFSSGRIEVVRVFKDTDSGSYWRQPLESSTSLNATPEFIILNCREQGSTLPAHQATVNPTAKSQPAASAISLADALEDVMQLPQNKDGRDLAIMEACRKVASPLIIYAGGMVLTPIARPMLTHNGDLTRLTRAKNPYTGPVNIYLSFSQFGTQQVVNVDAAWRLDVAAYQERLQRKGLEVEPLNFELEVLDPELFNNRPTGPIGKIKQAAFKRLSNLLSW